MTITPIRFPIHVIGDGSTTTLDLRDEVEKFRPAIFDTLPTAKGPAIVVFQDKRLAANFIATTKFPTPVIYDIDTPAELALFLREGNSPVWGIALDYANGDAKLWELSVVLRLLDEQFG